MQTDTQKKTELYNDDDYIDLGQMAADYLRCLKKYWIHFLLIVIITAVAVVLYFNRSYEPVYVAKITYAVNKTADANVNAFMAKSLSSAVPTVTSTSAFTEELLENMDEEGINGSYAITSAYTEGANLFSISVSSNDYKNANSVLKALEEVYPIWASKSNGTVELQTVDKSEAKDLPVNPYSLPKSLGMGVIAGLAICFVLATWYALTVKTIRKDSDMKKITGKNCISLIPEVKLKKREKSTKEQLLLSNKRIDWGFKQSVLAAQSRIEKQIDGKESRVLLVTSTLPQEGKSVVTVNLAQAFAKRDKKVLIIDGDLRNPSVGKLLNIEENQKGLADFFLEKAGLKEMLTIKEDVSIICGGTKRGEASGVVSEVKMMEMVTYLKRKFDYIFIDTPPTHLFTDAVIFERYADDVLYVVRHDYAESNDIKDGMSPFIRSGKLLGYIINRNPGGFSTYGKYGYSKYGHYGKYKRYIDLDESSMNTEDSL